MDDEKINALLAKLDEIARDYDEGVYGLPLIDPGVVVPLRQAVRDWLAGDAPGLPSITKLPSGWYLLANGKVEYGPIAPIKIGEFLSNLPTMDTAEIE